MESIARARRESRYSAANIRSDHMCSTSYCAKARLAIEIDGASHDMRDRSQRDIRRDAWPGARHHRRHCARELTRGIEETADAIIRMATERL
jgi:very-short-patch-repair endonuclease